MKSAHLNPVLPVALYDRLCAEALRRRQPMARLVEQAVLAAPVLPNRGPTHRTSFHAEPPTAEEAERKADASGMTTAAYVRAAIERFLG